MKIFRRKKTVGDVIRSMSDTQLAKLLVWENYDSTFDKAEYLYHTHLNTNTGVEYRQYARTYQEALNAETAFLRTPI